MLRPNSSILAPKPVQVNLTLDIGNTSTKAALFEKGTIREFARIDKITLGEVKHFVASFPIDASIISAVADFPNDISDWLEQEGHLILLSETTKMPISVKYSTPATLGKDRLMNAVGAFSLFPRKNTLIVDIGTCIKFDFVTANRG